MSSKLSADQVAELKKAFEVMDANKDGVVTRDELKTLLKGLGESVTDEVVDEMIKIADENNDGKIQFEEFVKAATEGNMWAMLDLISKKSATGRNQKNKSCEVTYGSIFIV